MVSGVCLGFFLRICVLSFCSNCDVIVCKLYDGGTPSAFTDAIQNVLSFQQYFFIKVSNKTLHLLSRTENAVTPLCDNKGMRMILTMQEYMKKCNTTSSKAHPTVQPTLNKPSIRTTHAAGTLCPTHQNSESTLDYKPNKSSMLIKITLHSFHLN